MTSYALVERARRLLPALRRWAAVADYERDGILRSVMFFLLACLEGTQVSRILESGRARGQSPLMLSLAFPRCPIVSVEHDVQSPDVAVTHARFAHWENVSLLFGDLTMETLSRRFVDWPCSRDQLQ